MSLPEAHYPTLDVNLSAITRNYALLATKAAPAHTAAVVKADAYGLGASQIAPALYDAGCRTFFVATLEEAIALRTVLDTDMEARVFMDEAIIYVLHGVRQSENETFLSHRLRPVINSIQQLDMWNDADAYALHIDTGMNRLGLSMHELEVLPEDMPKLALLMSHLACADSPDHPKNKEQCELFRTARSRFPKVPASLANSSGIFLDAAFHHELVRPGCSLYGITPNSSQANPMQNVVTLSAPILQYRTLQADESVGYDASVVAPKGTVLATVEMGYADGFLRCLSNNAFVYAAGQKLPIMGRVSMDMISVDVSSIPENQRTQDLRVTLIGNEQPVDVVAQAAGTIGYEIFTRLGSRVKRLYTA